MSTERLKAFSDGVIAILITIMVLELKVPHGTDLDALSGLVPVFLVYILSFLMLGIYWNNHHHMFAVTDRITGGTLWANIHLLFWLSLVPFVTGWMGENHFAPLPTALYGVVLLMAGVAYYILEQTIIRSQGASSRLKAAVGNDAKGLRAVVCDCDSARFRASTVGGRHLRCGGIDMADTGSAHRGSIRRTGEI
jgi:uncharacterized membrane protein